MFPMTAVYDSSFQTLFVRIKRTTFPIYASSCSTKRKKRSIAILGRIPHPWAAGWLEEWWWLVAGLTCCAMSLGGWMQDFVCQILILAWDVALKMEEESRITIGWALTLQLPFGQTVLFNVWLFKLDIWKTNRKLSFSYLSIYTWKRNSSKYLGFRTRENPQIF